MSDDFDSLKKLGKKMARSPSNQMLQQWRQTPLQAKSFRERRRIVNWWQLAAALIVGILIGKFLLQSDPYFFTQVAKNHTEDETFEHVYINN